MYSRPLRGYTVPFPSSINAKPEFGERGEGGNKIQVEEVQMDVELVRNEKQKSREEIRIEPRGVPTGWTFIKVSKFQMHPLYNQLLKSSSNYF